MLIWPLILVCGQLDFSFMCVLRIFLGFFFFTSSSTANSHVIFHVILSYLFWFKWLEVKWWKRRLGRNGSFVRCRVERKSTFLQMEANLIPFPIRHQRMAFLPPSRFCSLINRSRNYSCRMTGDKRKRASRYHKQAQQTEWWLTCTRMSVNWARTSINIMSNYVSHYWCCISGSIHSSRWGKYCVL